MSERPVVLVTRRLPEPVIARARTRYEVILNEDDHPFSKEELIAKAQNVDAILPCHPDRIDAEVIARLPERVRIIASYSVGVDHIDLEAARARGIVITNTPDVLSDATAEIAMLLILGAARRAAEGDRLIREGRWDHWSPDFMVGLEVTGRRLGILGMGRIGRTVARMARGFRMEVHYHNRRRLPPEEEGAIYHESLESLLAVSDILSLHCPATPETRHIINARTLAMLPENAILVNTARGALVDEAALIEALRSGRLFAAGLDVFEKEPGGNPELAALPNTFLLPHVGSATVETRNAMGFRALDNLDAFFEGREPPDRVV